MNYKYPSVETFTFSLDAQDSEAALAAFKALAPVEPEPTAKPTPLYDKHGDAWTLGADGLLHTPGTAPFPRELVEKKWGPLTEAPPKRPGADITAWYVDEDGDTWVQRADGDVTMLVDYESDTGWSPFDDTDYGYGLRPVAEYGEWMDRALRAEEALTTANDALADADTNIKTLGADLALSKSEVGRLKVEVNTNAEVIAALLEDLDRYTDNIDILERRLQEAEQSREARATVKLAVLRGKIAELIEDE